MAVSSLRTPIVADIMQDRHQVAAIDFGTTYSGYAFSTTMDFIENPLDVKGYFWETVGNVRDYKAPTSILFDFNKQFDSFGKDAEKKYNHLCEKGLEGEWYFFKRFKMKLYESVRECSLNGGRKSKRFEQKTDLARDMMLQETVLGNYGKEMLAMDVFSAVIKYLKRHLLDNVDGAKSKPAEIHWVVTVPAIWNDAAKQFMKEAAIQAGIDVNRLSLALEPEAASLYCKYLPTVRNIIEGDQKKDAIVEFRPGTKYVILDAGGGTVDITAHEVLQGGSLRELHAANGGDWGGVKVDDAFVNFLNKTVGADVIEVFRNENPDDYNEMMQTFEILKRSITPKDDAKITFQICGSLSDVYERLRNGDKMTSINGQSHRPSVRFDRNKLRLDPSIARGFFKDTCTQISSHLEELLNQASVSGVENILMVGGFSQSEMLQDCIRQSFGNGRNIIIPQEAGWAVLKGAVIYGHLPDVIVSRVCQYTYGLEVLHAFESALDPPSKRDVIDGRVLCRKRFSIHATVGQEFKMGEAFVSHQYRCSDPADENVELAVYRSRSTNPRHVDESGSQRIGAIQLKLTKSNSDREKNFSVKIVFGGTELGVEAVENQTGKINKGKMEFLDRDI